MIADLPTSLTSVSANYPRKPDGSVNWRAMLQPEHLYCKHESKPAVATLLGKTAEEVYNLSPEDIARVPDKYLVIRKAGILELARLRGYSSALPDVKHVQRDYVVIQTWVTWAPFEGQPEKRTGGVGEATIENTTKLGGAYLASTAQNRAFARAVRDYLEIDIVSSDELGGNGVEPDRESSSSSSSSGSVTTMDLGPSGSLQRAAANSPKRFTFEQVKQAAVKRYAEDTIALAKDPAYVRRIENEPSVWADWKSVPPRDCLTLIKLIKDFDEAAAKAEAAKATAAATAPAGAAKKPAATKTSVAPVIPLAAPATEAIAA